MSRCTNLAFDKLDGDVFLKLGALKFLLSPLLAFAGILLRGSGNFLHFFDYRHQISSAVFKHLDFGVLGGAVSLPGDHFKTRFNLVGGQTTLGVCDSTPEGCKLLGSTLLG